MGKRRKTKNRIPEEIKEAIRERSDYICEAMIPEAGCEWKATDMHHRQMRSQGGQHEVVNLVHICRACHRYTHLHPAISYTAGFLVKSHGNPATTPVKRRGGFTILTEEGGFNDPESGG